MTVTEKEEKKNRPSLPIPIASAVCIALGLFAALIHILILFFPDFADLVNSTLGHFVRLFLSKLFGFFPFSFMELLILSSPVIIIITAIKVFKAAKRGKAFLIRALSVILAIFSLVYFFFGVSFAPGYRGATLYEHLGLEKKEVTADELFRTASIVCDELYELCDSVKYFENGASALDLSYDELSLELSLAYERVSEEYGYFNTFSSSPKPIMLSPLMTYTHLTGIYSFFTGEANINTNFPDFIIVHTYGHEMAHQRGISREDEANFTSFLACRAADSPYIRYCAYLNMFLYLSNALFEADPSLHQKAYALLPEKAHGDLIAYAVFFEEYEDAEAAKVAESMNSAYLESQGTEGTKSYGLVVDLAVAFFLADNPDTF